MGMSSKKQTAAVGLAYLKAYLARHGAPPFPNIMGRLRNKTSRAEFSKLARLIREEFGAKSDLSKAMRQSYYSKYPQRRADLASVRAYRGLTQNTLDMAPALPLGHGRVLLFTVTQGFYLAAQVWKVHSQDDSHTTYVASRLGFRVPMFLVPAVIKTLTQLYRRHLNYDRERAMSEGS